MSRVAKRAAASAAAPVVTVAGIDAADCLADEPPPLQLAIAGSTSARAAKRRLRRFTLLSLRRGAPRTTGDAAAFPTTRRVKFNPMRVFRVAVPASRIDVSRAF